MLVGCLEHIVGGVAHALNAVFIRDMRFKHDGGIDVAQIVEAIVRDTGFFADA